MKRTFLLAVILLFAATACGTLYGAGIGAGSGAAIAAGTGHSPARGALLGAGIGAAAGAIYDATRPAYGAPQPSCYTRPGYWSQVPAYGYDGYPTYQTVWVPPQTVCQ